MAVSKAAADIPELCRTVGLIEVPHPVGYGYMVRTKVDFDLAVKRFRERTGKDPVTFNWKPAGSLILSEVPARTGQEFSDARARSRAAASAPREIQSPLSDSGAGSPEPGLELTTERSTSSLDVVLRQPDVDATPSPVTLQPLSELPSLDARCEVCGGDLAGCWCEPDSPLETAANAAI